MIEEGFLQVSKLHKIYYSTYGNKNGIPLLFIHGGPGGSSDGMKQFDGIDLNKFYCIAYDQRGCGKSIPSGELRENTTQDLIEDIKTLLNHLNVKKVVITASSWGACLALLFAEKYTEMIERIFLRSTFLARLFDKDWLYKKSKAIFPDLYKKFIESLIEEENIENYSQYFLDKLEKGSFEEKQKIACYISSYEYGLMLMSFNNSTFRSPDTLEDIDINATRIFLHYEANSFFIEENYIIKNCDKIKDVKINFYHGRFDMDCPISGVYELNSYLKNSNLVIVPYESHIGNLMKDLMKRDINSLSIWK